MTKEWQEATNEYLKVNIGEEIWNDIVLTSFRKNESTLSTVSAAKVTKARVLFRARQQRLRAFLSSLTKTTLFRCVQPCSSIETASDGFVGGNHGRLDGGNAYISIAESIAYVQKLYLIDCATLWLCSTSISLHTLF